MLALTAIEPLLRFDSWGKLLSTSGSIASALGKNNPFRYRGYVYDEETGFYYLQSRYYDPEVGRFISADVFLSSGSYYAAKGGNVCFVAGTELLPVKRDNEIIKNFSQLAALVASCFLCCKIKPIMLLHRRENAEITL